MDWLIVGFGFGVGVLIGLTGIGGASLMTPVLVLFANVKPAIAIGTDLAYGAITKTVGAWHHWRNGTVDFGVAMWLAAGTVPGSLIGIWLLKHLRISPNTLLLFVAAALLLAALAILARALFFARLVRERHSVQQSFGTKTLSIGSGLVLGAMLGMTSVGSGALIGLVLIVFFRLTPHRVVGTDIFHAAVLLWVAGSAHFVAGNVDVALAGNILLGSIPGIYIGSSLVRRVPANALRIVLGCVLLCAALAILTKTSLAIPASFVIGAPIIVALLIWLIYPGKFLSTNNNADMAAK